MKGKNFSLDLLEEEQANSMSTDTNDELWHKRMGHFNHVALMLMKKMDLVQGLPSLNKDLPSCQDCLFGK